MLRTQSDGLRTKGPLRVASWPLRATVLCVEDEPDSLAILEWFLTAEGLTVVTACSAAEALLKVDEHRPDIILTDHLMPGMTGLELCGHLRGFETTRAIPIIVYTALSLPVQSSLYDRTLLKPTDFDVILRQIRSLLPRAR